MLPKCVESMCVLLFYVLYVVLEAYGSEKVFVCGM